MRLRSLFPRLLSLAAVFAVASTLTSCHPSVYFTSKIAADTAVTIVTEKYIPYGSDDYEIEEVVLPGGDIVIVRSLEDDTAVVERFHNDTMRVVWAQKFYLGDHGWWTPKLYYDETEGFLSMIAMKSW